VVWIASHVIFIRFNARDAGKSTGNRFGLKQDVHYLIVAQKRISKHVVIVMNYHANSLLN